LYSAIKSEDAEALVASG